MRVLLRSPLAPRPPRGRLSPAESDSLQDFFLIEAWSPPDGRAIDTASIFASIEAMLHKSSAVQGFISMARCARRTPLALAAAFLALTLAGCGGDQIEATNKLVQQQQEQIEKQQQEIEAIKASQNQNYTPGVATSASASASGGCDKQVEQTATERG